MVTTKRAFTVIEMLVSIAIIGLLTTLLVPMVDRNLGKNRLANDAEMFRAKLEEVRLLSGSTQGSDESTFTSGDDRVKDEVGHYAMLIPKANRGSDYFAVVRLSDPVSITLGGADPPPPNYCSASLAISHADPSSSFSSDERFCLVDRVTLSSGVGLTNNGENRLVSFKVPSKQINEITKDRENWGVSAPIFDWVFSLTSGGKTAKVNLEPYTAKVVVTYSSTSGGEN